MKYSKPQPVKIPTGKGDRKLTIQNPNNNPIKTNGKQ